MSTKQSAPSPSPRAIPRQAIASHPHNKHCITHPQERNVHHMYQEEVTSTFHVQAIVHPPSGYEIVLVVTSTVAYVQVSILPFIQ